MQPETTQRIDYIAYLRSPEWARKRQLAIDRADGRCQLCNSGIRLQVHHRTYERLGHEKLEDLTVLCRSCHAKFHDVGKAKAGRSGTRQESQKTSEWKKECIATIKKEMSYLDEDGRFETMDMFERIGGDLWTYKQIKQTLKTMQGRGQVVRISQRGWRRPESRLKARIP